MEAVDIACCYEKPLLKFERVLETFLAVAPGGLRTFLDTIALTKAILIYVSPPR